MKLKHSEQLIDRIVLETGVHRGKVFKVLKSLDKLIVDLPEIPMPCTYTMAHTKSWCGHPLCRES
jgi:hypothetical protein